MSRAGKGSVMQGRKRGLARRAAVIAGAVGVCIAGSTSALAAGGPAGPVSTTPGATPQLNTTGTTEQVRQLVQCGGTMYAVGTFTSIKQGSTIYARNNAFSFSATAPYAMTTWNPNVNGEVNSIAFNGSSCADAYIGGKFTSVDGTAVKDIAEVSTSTGAVAAAFGHNAESDVQTLVVTNGHVLAGGSFTSINNSSASKYMASLNPTTGKVDSYLSLGISGNYGSGGTKVYNQQISHGGTLELVEGTFQTVGGQARQQIFMLSLGSTAATVTGWTSPEFFNACTHNESFYVRAASWSPDDNTIYLGTTGYKPATGVGTGLCDSASAFPATQTSVTHKWINYTGCDSFYSTAADTNDAYFGGHERWADNPNACDAAGPGAIPAPGMVGLSPTTGAVVFNPSRARGLGADDMLITSAGLWIASDNLQGSSQCAGKQGHAGICFLPYA
jgi:hypothetical protein